MDTAVGFWKWLFNLGVEEIDHPRFGRITRISSNTWNVPFVEPIGCRGTPSLLIAGDEHGPEPDCVSTYERLRDEWENIKPHVLAEMFELNQNYCSDNPEQELRSREQALDDAKLLAIGVEGDGDFSFTYVFDWQDPADGHEITMYFKKWEPQGCSIDG